MSFARNVLALPRFLPKLIKGGRCPPSSPKSPPSLSEIGRHRWPASPSIGRQRYKFLKSSANWLKASIIDRPPQIRRDPDRIRAEFGELWHEFGRSRTKRGQIWPESKPSLVESFPTQKLADSGRNLPNSVQHRSASADPGPSLFEHGQFMSNLGPDQAEFDRFWATPRLRSRSASLLQNFPEVTPPRCPS